MKKEILCNEQRIKIKSELFFIKNMHRNNSGEIKFIELTPFKHNIIDKIFIYSNSVVFFSKNNPICEINNIFMDTNTELTNSIKHILNKF